MMDQDPSDLRNARELPPRIESPEGLSGPARKLYDEVSARSPWPLSERLALRDEAVRLGALVAETEDRDAARKLARHVLDLLLPVVSEVGIRDAELWTVAGRLALEFRDIKWRIAAADALERVDLDPVGTRLLNDLSRNLDWVLVSFRSERKQLERGLERARAGNVTAMLSVALRYYRGTGTLRNAIAAGWWRKKAMDAGDERAPYIFGLPFRSYAEYRKLRRNLHARVNEAIERESPDVATLDQLLSRLGLYFCRISDAAVVSFTAYYKGFVEDLELAAHFGSKHAQLLVLRLAVAGETRLETEPGRILSYVDRLTDLGQCESAIVAAAYDYALRGYQEGKLRPLSEAEMNAFEYRHALHCLNGSREGLQAEPDNIRVLLPEKDVPNAVESQDRD